MNVSGLRRCLGKKMNKIYQSALRWIRKHLLLPLIWRCHFSGKQLQKKFKHAGDFGIVGNYNKFNAEQFKQALLNHIINPNTKVIRGSYKGQPVKHFFNPMTKLNIICDNHKFLSGWLLAPEQEQYLLSNGHLT